MVQCCALIYMYHILMSNGVFGKIIRRQESNKFSLSSLMEATIPLVHPIVAAGSNKCESFKRFFGITYEQLKQKNNTNFLELLEIDLIKKDQNIKFNVTDPKKFMKVFENSKNVTILVHGFMESSNGWMVQALAPEYAKKPDMTLLALDGRKLINLEYFISSTYVRFIGEVLGAVLSHIINNSQANPSNITIVGHSLGAHIAGVAGYKVLTQTGRQIGRITGLDPAGPCFTNSKEESRLDKSDAAYVDVIHTNGGFLGLGEPVGHKDFYPNGGMMQPGCYLSTCDHSRAWEYFAESINSPNRFKARLCNNQTGLNNEICRKNETAYMGFNSAKGKHGVYYLITRPSIPYSLDNLDV